MITAFRGHLTSQPAGLSFHPSVSPSTLLSSRTMSSIAGALDEPVPKRVRTEEPYKVHPWHYTIVQNQS